MRLGVSREILDEDYLIQIACLDPEVRATVEEKFIKPYPCACEFVSRLQAMSRLAGSSRPDRGTTRSLALFCAG